MFQKTIYPLRFYEINLQTGVLCYFDKPGGTLKKAINQSELISCSLGSGANTEGEMRDGKPQTGTNDFPFIFQLQTSQRTFFFFAASRQEREVWLDQF